ncbi:hypothetical protein GCM10010433_36180 [Streptomyces pulveraceus]
MVLRFVESRGPVATMRRLTPAVTMRRPTLVVAMRLLTPAVITWRLTFVVAMRRLTRSAQAPAVPRPL